MTDQSANNQGAAVKRASAIKAAREFFTAEGFVPNDHQLGKAYDAGLLRAPEDLIEEKATKERLNILTDGLTNIKEAAINTIADVFSPILMSINPEACKYLRGRDSMVDHVVDQLNIQFNENTSWFEIVDALFQHGANNGHHPYADTAALAQKYATMPKDSEQNDSVYFWVKVFNNFIVYLDHLANDKLMLERPGASFFTVRSTKDDDYLANAYYFTLVIRNKERTEAIGLLPPKDGWTPRALEWAVNTPQVRSKLLTSWSSANAYLVDPDHAPESTPEEILIGSSENIVLEGREYFIAHEGMKLKVRVLSKSDLVKSACVEPVDPEATWFQLKWADYDELEMIPA